MPKSHRLSTRAIDAAVRAAINTPEPNAIDVPLSAMPDYAQGGRRGQSCAAQHFGAWAILPRWMAQAAAAVREGTWAASGDMIDENEDDDFGQYELLDGNIALIEMSGQITKHRSSFGGCSSVETKASIRRARRAMVRGIVINADSPGGTVSGTSELAAEVIAARLDGIPVVVAVDGLCCSAMYWVASQATRIVATEGSLIGCIGTYCVLEDSTAASEKQGFKYTVVGTGPYKGLGADGAVTDLLVSDVQREVIELNQPFLAAVARGRKTDSQTVARWADGRSHGAAQALQLGLIDAVSTLDAAIGFATLSKDTMQTATLPAPAGKVAERTAHVADDTVPAPTDAPAEAAVDTTSADYKAGYDAGYAKGQEDAAKEDAKEPGEPPMAPAAVAPAASTSLPDLITACGGDKATAMDYAIAGFNATQAKAAYVAVKTAKDEAAAANKRAAQAEFAAESGKVIGTKTAAVATAPIPDSPESNDPTAKKQWAEAKAGQEWDTNPDSHKGYSTKERFVAIKSRELIGLHRTLTK